MTQLEIKKARTVARINRQRWHRDDDQWQVTDASGVLFACHYRPFISKVVFGSWACYNGDWQLGPSRKRPKNYTATLRRIVNRKPKIKTVTRKPWHRAGDRWQVQNASGVLFACRTNTPPKLFDGLWVHYEIHNDFWNAGPRVFGMEDYTTTLRRIVDRKPKRKTLEDD